MRKRIAVLLLALVMMMMSAAPALAQGGCKAFGHQIRTYAHQHRMGDIASEYASGPDSYPGRMALFIRFEKETYCHSAFPG